VPPRGQRQTIAYSPISTRESARARVGRPGLVYVGDTHPRGAKRLDPARRLVEWSNHIGSSCLIAGSRAAETGAAHCRPGLPFEYAPFDHAPFDYAQGRQGRRARRIAQWDPEWWCLIQPGAFRPPVVRRD
jgi:hypothetical protein